MNNIDEVVNEALNCAARNRVSASVEMLADDFARVVLMQTYDDPSSENMMLIRLHNDKAGIYTGKLVRKYSYSKVLPGAFDEGLHIEGTDDIDVIHAYLNNVMAGYHDIFEKHTEGLNKISDKTLDDITYMYLIGRLFYMFNGNGVAGVGFRPIRHMVRNNEPGNSSALDLYATVCDSIRSYFNMANCEFYYKVLSKF